MHANRLTCKRCFAGVVVAAAPVLTPVVVQVLKARRSRKRGAEKNLFGRFTCGMSGCLRISIMTVRGIRYGTYLGMFDDCV